MVKNYWALPMTDSDYTPRNLGAMKIILSYAFSDFKFKNKQTKIAK